MPTRIATLDCETDPFLYGRIPEPFIWGFYDGEDFEVFDTTESMIEFLKEFDGVVYAHNGGKFDYHFMLPYAEAGQEIKIINGRLAEIRFGKARCRDSFSILPVPLARLNKSEFDYAKLERSCRELHRPEIIAYLRSDCENLFYYVREFIERYSFSLTLAGAAFKEWQKMEGKVSQQGPAHYERFSPWYFGGRVSPFDPGVHESHFSVYDINSAYPTAMMNDHPCGAQTKMTVRPFDREIPRSFLRVKGFSRGAFPVRDETGKINFPHGTGEFLVTGWEFIAALETKTFHCHKILGGHVFADSINFSEYVNRFYAEKQRASREGDKAGREFAKLFLNSLYGKFASNPANYAEYMIGEWGEEPPPEWETGTLIGETQIFQRPLPESKQRWYDVVTAASITGWVRAYLWRSICSVEHPYYCDTDSIICARAPELALSDSLGDWQHEGNGFRLAIAGRKMYAAWMDDGSVKKASKGVNLSPEEILRVANGETITYYRDAPTFSTRTGVGFIAREVRNTAA